MIDQQVELYRTSWSLPENAGQEPSFVCYLRVVRRHWVMISLLCIISMAGTVGFMLTRPAKFRASATILPSIDMMRQQSGLNAGLGLGGLGATLLRQALDGGGFIQVQVQILLSRTVANEVINECELMEVYEGVESQAQARRVLAKRTRVEVTPEGVLKVSVIDFDPAQSAEIANAYIDALDRQNKRLSGGQATSKRVFLENRVQQIEKRFSNIDVIPAHEARVQEVLHELLIRECELAKIEEARSMPTIQVLDHAIAPELRMARGTVGKGIMAGVAATLLGIILAFVCEYVKEVRSCGR